MATVKKRLLSGSTNGKQIKVAQVTTPGTAIHTAVAGTTPGTVDEIWLWACNHSNQNATLVIEFGGASDPDDHMVFIIPPWTFQPIVPGLILQNGLVVSAYATLANIITISGFVNTITD
jgi:hypothetical protein